MTCVAVALVVLTSSVPIARGQEPARAPDCGVNALFLLLHLQGKPVTLGEVEKALPARIEDGYSMAELARASRTLGLPLDGVRFGRGDPPLDRSAIAYFQDSHAGHFAVLRPVGTTGTMLQVIDPPNPPQIVDYERLFRQTPWAGRVLLARPPWRPWPVVLVLAVGVGLVAVVRFRVRRRTADPAPDAPLSTAAP